MSALTPVQRLDSKVRAGERIQQKINKIAGGIPYGEMSIVRDLLLVAAEASHAEFPQYEGHWDNWMVARVDEGLTGKGGVHAVEGDIVLLNIEKGIPGLAGTLIHSNRTMIDVALPRYFKKTVLFEK